MIDHHLAADGLDRPLPLGIVQVIGALRSGGVDQALVLVVGVAATALGGGVAVGIEAVAGVLCSADAGDPVAAALVAVGGDAGGIGLGQTVASDI